MSILSKLSGYRTYLAAAGLFGLALYKASVGDYQGAVDTLGIAATAAGMRAAIAKG
ncbi:hypothetical protein P12x_003073 [Tundrisphaera lichenicola]|uniref:hypothetical protein n=1 Tax=Tundrisphaera lichenicola TaxID=2029860 RepID=UPI003EBFE3E7